jgi:hypothetical protein
MSQLDIRHELQNAAAEPLLPIECAPGRACDRQPLRAGELLAFDDAPGRLRSSARDAPAGLLRRCGNLV